MRIKNKERKSDFKKRIGVLIVRYFVVSLSFEYTKKKREKENCATNIRRFEFDESLMPNNNGFVSKIWPFRRKFMNWAQSFKPILYKLWEFMMMILLLFCAYLLNCNKWGKEFAAPPCWREEEEKKKNKKIKIWWVK